MDFKNELEKLISLYRNNEVENFKVQYETLENHFPERMDEVKASLQVAIDESIRKFDVELEELTLKVQLSKVTEAVSLSYIAEHYFNRTRNWLYQRINNNIVNGKQAKFTDEELKKLQFAIHDIGRKLSEFQISSAV